MIPAQKQTFCQNQGPFDFVLLENINAAPNIYVVVRMPKMVSTTPNHHPQAKALYAAAGGCISHFAPLSRRFGGGDPRHALSYLQVLQSFQGLFKDSSKPQSGFLLCVQTNPRKKRRNKTPNLKQDLDPQANKSWIPRQRTWLLPA